MTEIFDWANANEGVVSILLFMATLIIGWLSGAFAFLRQRPKFRIDVIPGPTLVVVIPTGKKQNEEDIHRTVVALYLRIANVGAAASSFDNIAVAYRWNINRFGWVWLKTRFTWQWMPHPTVAIEPFQCKIGDSVKFYPSLFQANIPFQIKQDSFLEVGNSVNGVVYFEGYEAWGGCFPRNNGKTAKLKVRVTDAFGRHHTAGVAVPVATLEEARQFNPSFGTTHSQLTSHKLQSDTAEKR